MRSVRFQTALNHGVLYPQFIINIVLYLHRFRRKPAISKFDWLFTPKYKSSPPIATDVGSVLQKVLPFFQLAHTQITWFRVKLIEQYLLHIRANARITLASTYRFKHAQPIYSLTHYTKGKLLFYFFIQRCYIKNKTLTDCKHSISRSFSLPYQGSFHLSLTVLFRY